MTPSRHSRSALRASLFLLAAPFALAAQAGECKRIHANLTEVSATQGCNPSLASCFLGEVDGNHGLNGTTHFHADSAAAGPSTSPGFISYSGEFEYRTSHGTLFMRETGVTHPDVVTAYQKVVDADGGYSGATGYFFVSGTKANGIISTEVSGELCLP